MAGDDNPAPPPQTCSQAGCRYNTPIGAPSWDVVLGLLQVHAQTAHPPPAAHGPPRGGGDGGANQGIWTNGPDRKLR